MSSSQICAIRFVVRDIGKLPFWLKVEQSLFVLWLPQREIILSSYRPDWPTDVGKIVKFIVFAIIMIEKNTTTKLLKFTSCHNPQSCSSLMKEYIYGLPTQSYECKIFHTRPKIAIFYPKRFFGILGTT